MGLVVAIICEIDFNIIPTLSSHNLYYVKFPIQDDLSITS